MFRIVAFLISLVLVYCVISGFLTSDPINGDPPMLVKVYREQGGWGMFWGTVVFIVVVIMGIGAKDNK